MTKDDPGAHRHAFMRQQLAMTQAEIMTRAVSNADSLALSTQLEYEVALLTQVEYEVMAIDTGNREPAASFKLRALYFIDALRDVLEGRNDKG